MVEAAILTCRWLGPCPTHPSQRYGLCLRRFFMVNLPHGREIQGSLGVRSLSLGVRSLLLRSILRLVWLNGLSVTAFCSRWRFLYRLVSAQPMMKARAQARRAGSCGRR